MKPAEYISEAKQRLNLKSDYAIAKKIGLSDKHMPEIKKGTRAMPLDVAYKLAIVLDMDPAEVVADLESQREKSPERKAFWTGFIQRARIILTVAACTLALISSATYENAAAFHNALRRRFGVA